MDVTFKTAKAFLESKLPLTQEHCSSRVAGLLVPIEGMRAIKTYFPEDYQNELASTAYPIEAMWSNYNLEEKLYQILGRHFSVSDMAVERVEDQESFLIPIEPLGPQYSWDDFNEDVENPENLSEWAGPGFLIQMLDHDWQEGWETIIEHFGWDLAGQPEFPSHSWWVNLEMLYQKFRERGLKCLIWLWKVNTWTTGNLFWDIDLYDETAWGEELFDPKAIPTLLKAWRRAQRIRKLFEAANQMVLDHPELIPLQVELFKEAIQRRGEAKDIEHEAV